MNHVFQSFWYGETLSPYEELCIRSFLDHGYSFHLYTYSSQLEVPRGAELRDAAELLNPRDYFTYKRGRGAGSHSAFSNVFRYKLLAERGGWWVDTDVICLSSHIPHFSDFLAYESDGVVNGAVLHFPRGDPLMLDCLKEAMRVGDSASWGEIGPLLLTRKAKELGRLNCVQPNTACYPVHWTEAFDLLRPSRTDALKERTRDSFFLHLWNEAFRRANLTKTMLPPRGSLLREIVQRHPTEGWGGEYDINCLERGLFVESELERLRKENKGLRKELQKNQAQR
jgi:hypothetical protein